MTTPPRGLYVLRIDIGGMVLALLSYEVSPAAHLPPFTDAERAVLSAVLEGKTNAQIAAERRTSARTVANQVAGLFRKLGVRSRAELAVRCAVQR